MTGQGSGHGQGQGSATEQIVGRYAICGELASGGMATIHVGHPIGSTRPVAIKKLHKPYAANVEFLTMFLDEMWVAARVRHVNIVETLDVISHEGELSLVMEYVEGETLSKLLRAHRERKALVPVPIVAGILCGALEGLHAAHEAKDEKGQPLHVVHRDVSPQNVMIGIDGVPKLLDFGVAKAAVRLQSTRAGQLKGKIAYMAPEQLESQQASRITDVYSAGVVFWEALTAQRLFEADSEGQLLLRVLQGPQQPPSALRAGLHPDLDAIAMRAMARDPDDRYPTARQMARAIELATPVARAQEIADWLQATARTSLEGRAHRVAEMLAGRATSSARVPVSPGSDPHAGSTPSSSSRPSVSSQLSSPSSPSSLRSSIRAKESVPSVRAGKRSGKSVLVIDDSEVILQNVRRVLEAEGVNVVTTTQTVGAARHLVDCDLAIIDFHMPGIDGGSVIQSLRGAATATGRTCLFYLYTADPAVAKDYARLGFDGSFTEKGDDAALLRQVRGAFRVLSMRAMKKQ